MEDRRPRERELVLAPNEYAYVLDVTKGHVNCYVGPNKTSLAQTDQPVLFDAETRRFVPVESREAVSLFATAPANWYLVLESPAKDGSHPPAGVASHLVELSIGRRVNVEGPASFALWPGQIARVIEGHRLRSNEYLYAQIHDAAAATAAGARTLGFAEGTRETAAFVTGQKLLIRGTDVAFYVPPTGVEVIPDEDGRHVREAVTLQRLEYCVLVGEDGRKRFVRGEAVVFPEPSERFLEQNGRRTLCAIELSETTGIHVKVIAPYVDEEGVAHVEGDELFLGGKDGLYFPREEHAFIVHGTEEVHHAVAIPAGEGRYVLDRRTGDIRLAKGPTMLLPDPRREVLTRRVLSERECELLYPGNAEVLAFNRSLRRGGRPDPTEAPPTPTAGGRGGPQRGEKQVEGRAPADAVDGSGRAMRAGSPSDAFARSASFQGPRVLLLDTRFDGAVTVEVWSGFAVQVVNRRGERRVVRGPATLLLEYDETLEALSLSTGTPKSSDRLLRTAFLQVTGNHVGDRVDVQTADLVRARITLKYRVNFEGDDPSRWFAVDNYVKLLCDHASSILKAVLRKTSVRKLRAEGTDLVRDAILGTKRDDGARPGLRFADNGMHVHDVDVLDVALDDAAVEELLAEAQLASIRAEVAVAERERTLANRRVLEEVERALLREAQATKLLELGLEAERADRGHGVERERLAQRSEVDALRAAQALATTRADGEVARERLAITGAEHAASLARQAELQALDVALLQARTEAAVRQASALTPELVATVQRLGDAQLLSALASNFGGLAAVEGKGLLETARKFLDWVPASSLPVLKARE